MATAIAKARQSIRYLTPLAVERMKPGPVRIEVPDGGFQRLYLIVHPSGRKVWALRYRYAGRPRKLTLGSFPAVDLDKARTRAGAAIRALEAGTDPAHERAAGKADTPALEPDTFGAVVRSFIKRHAQPNTRSWKETARLLGLAPDPADGERLIDLRGGLAARWAARPIDGLRRRDVIAALDDIADRAPIVANRTLGALRRLANWCVARDMLDAPFTAGVEAPGLERSRSRVLSDGELAHVWQAAQRAGYPFGHLVKLLLLTGQRRQEVAAMTWGELDLDARTWQLAPERTKNGRAHMVPLSSAALAVIREAPRFAGGDYLLTGTGRSPFSGFSKSFRRLVADMDAAAGEAIEPWVLHDLRRTVATGMAGIGVAPHVVEAVLNHQSGHKASVAGVYNRQSYAREKAEALEAWGAHVLAIVGEVRG